MPFLPLVHLPHVSHRKLHSGLSDPSTDSSKAAKASIRPRHLTLERMQGVQGGVGDQVGDGGGGRGWWFCRECCSGASSGLWPGHSPIKVWESLWFLYQSNLGCLLNMQIPGFHLNPAE